MELEDAGRNSDNSPLWVKVKAYRWYEPSLWLLLISSPSPLLRSDHRRRARLFSLILFVILVTGIIMNSLATPGSQQFFSLLAANICLSFAYLASRTRHYKLASSASVFLLWALTIVTVGFNAINNTYEDVTVTDPTNWLFLPALYCVCAVFLSRTGTVSVVVTDFVGCMVLPFIVDASYFSMRKFLFFHCVMDVLLLLASIIHFRDKLQLYYSAQGISDPEAHMESRLGRLLVRPHDAVSDRILRRRTRILSLCLLILIPANILWCISEFRMNADSSVIGLSVGYLVGILVLYAMSRSPLYKWASRATLAAFLLFPYFFSFCPSTAPEGAMFANLLANSAAAVLGIALLAGEDLVTLAAIIFFPTIYSPFFPPHVAMSIMLLAAALISRDEHEELVSAGDTAAEIPEDEDASNQKMYFGGRFTYLQAARYSFLGGFICCFILGLTPLIAVMQYNGPLRVSSQGSLSSEATANYRLYVTVGHCPTELPQQYTIIGTEARLYFTYDGELVENTVNVLNVHVQPSLGALKMVTVTLGNGDWKLGQNEQCEINNIQILDVATGVSVATNSLPLVSPAAATSQSRKFATQRSGNDKDNDKDKKCKNQISRSTLGAPPSGCEVEEQAFTIVAQLLCFLFPCSNKGDCEVDFESRQLFCRCDDGFTGARCQTSLRELCSNEGGARTDEATCNGPNDLGSHWGRILVRDSPPRFADDVQSIDQTLISSLAVSAVVRERSGGKSASIYRSTDMTKKPNVWADAFLRFVFDDIVDFRGKYTITDSYVLPEDSSFRIYRQPFKNGRKDKDRWARIASCVDTDCSCEPGTCNSDRQIVLRPRYYVNDQTSPFDGSGTYGAALRAPRFRMSSGGLLQFYFSGKLKYLVKNKDAALAMECGQFPQKSVYMIGDRRGNANPLTIALHTLAMKNHNRVAAKLQSCVKSTVPNVVLFNAARLINVAQFHQVLRELLRSLNFDSAVEGERCPPKNSLLVSLETTLFMNWFDGRPATVATAVACETPLVEHKALDVAFNTAFFEAQGLDKIIQGGLRQQLTPGVAVGWNDFNGTLLGRPESRTDIIVSLIEMSRDLGLGSFNDVRKAYCLPVLSCDPNEPPFFDPQVCEYYNNKASEVELAVGLLFDNGDLARRIFLGALNRLLVNDAFQPSALQKTLGTGSVIAYFKDKFKERGQLCVGAELQYLHLFTFKTLIKENSAVEFVQDAAFELPNGGNPNTCPTTGYSETQPTSSPTRTPTPQPSTVLSTPQPSTVLSTPQPSTVLSTPQPSTVLSTPVPTTSPTPAPSTLSPSTLSPNTVSPTTGSPTRTPTSAPTLVPTLAPVTLSPSSRSPTLPTPVPTKAPSTYPTSLPTVVPTSVPTILPTKTPTLVPTPSPTTNAPVAKPASNDKFYLYDGSNNLYNDKDLNLANPNSAYVASLPTVADLSNKVFGNASNVDRGRSRLSVLAIAYARFFLSDVLEVQETATEKLTLAGCNSNGGYGKLASNTQNLQTPVMDLSPIFGSSSKAHDQLKDGYGFLRFDPPIFAGADDNNRGYVMTGRSTSSYVFLSGSPNSNVDHFSIYIHSRFMWLHKKFVTLLASPSAPEIKFEAARVFVVMVAETISRDLARELGTLPGGTLDFSNGIPAEFLLMSFSDRFPVWLPNYADSARVDNFAAESALCSSGSVSYESTTYNIASVQAALEGVDNIAWVGYSAMYTRARNGGYLSPSLRCSSNGIGHFAGKPYDPIAAVIQRGRDHAFPTCHSYRAAHGLPSVSFSSFGNSAFADAFATAYGNNFTKVELSVCMLLDSDLRDRMMGSLILSVLQLQNTSSYCSSNEVGNFSGTPVALLSNYVTASNSFDTTALNEVSIAKALCRTNSKVDLRGLTMVNQLTFVSEAVINLEAHYNLSTPTITGYVDRYVACTTGNPFLAPNAEYSPARSMLKEGTRAICDWSTRDPNGPSFFLGNAPRCNSEYTPTPATVTRRCFCAARDACNDHGVWLSSTQCTCDTGFLQSDSSNAFCERSSYPQTLHLLDQFGSPTPKCSFTYDSAGLPLTDAVARTKALDSFCTAVNCSLREGHYLSGACNSPINADLGRVGSTLGRIVPANYANGISFTAPVPSTSWYDKFAAKWPTPISTSVSHVEGSTTVNVNGLFRAMGKLLMDDVLAVTSTYQNESGARSGTDASNPAQFQNLATGWIDESFLFPLPSPLVAPYLIPELGLLGYLTAFPPNPAIVDPAEVALRNLFAKRYNQIFSYFRTQAPCAPLNSPNCNLPAMSRCVKEIAVAEFRLIAREWLNEAKLLFPNAKTFNQSFVPPVELAAAKIFDLHWATPNNPTGCSPPSPSLATFGNSPVMCINSLRTATLTRQRAFSSTLTATFDDMGALVKSLGLGSVNSYLAMLGESSLAHPLSDNLLLDLHDSAAEYAINFGIFDKLLTLDSRDDAYATCSNHPAYVGFDGTGLGQWDSLVKQWTTVTRSFCEVLKDMGSGSKYSLPLTFQMKPSMFRAGAATGACT